MQKKTKYCNSLVSKVLPTINEIGDNNLIFNQIDNSLCFQVGKSLYSLFLLNIIREVSCYRTIHYFCGKYLKEDAQ